MKCSFDSTSNMTEKQIKDLQLYAVELAKHGKDAAAREVLLLLARK